MSEPAATSRTSWQVKRIQREMQHYSQGYSSCVAICIVSPLNGLFALPTCTQMQVQQAIDGVDEV